MTDIEKKLANYRAKRNREAFYAKFKQNFISFFSGESSKDSKENLLKSDNNEEYIIQTTSDNLSDTDSLDEEDDVILNCCTYIDWIYYSLYFILWSTIYSLFIKLEFGTVYLIITGLIAIYLNTRTRPKMDGEISAYSVFNKDCESIDGTLKAEQFEREIRYGPAMIR
ncbi:hypothetical protein NQ314_007410 [Rhamnusium bicolor]|uniref:SAYSvFN domain-containing protein n=1 Tax=Rhamnusium bicolor TaxID=1586634 RepID=A0AAV8YNF6_9CUCU|nr:hypothetical protein NQ314_007410 [Rhamnusium bicolor]